MDAYGNTSTLESEQWGASIGHLQDENCRKTTETTRGEMVAMPTGTKQPDQLTSTVNC